MNILELCLSSGLGGLELYVFRSNEALANSQLNQNTVIAVLRQDSKLDKYYKDHSASNIQYIKHFFSPLPLLNARKLASIIDNNNIDVIHMHWGKDLAISRFCQDIL